MANTKIVEIVLAIGNVTVSDVSSTFRRYYSLLRPPQEQGSRYPMRVIAVNQRFRSSGSFFFLRTVRKRIGAFLQGVKGSARPPISAEFLYLRVSLCRMYRGFVP